MLVHELSVIITNIYIRRTVFCLNRAVWVTIKSTPIAKLQLFERLDTKPYSFKVSVRGSLLVLL